MARQTSFTFYANVNLNLRTNDTFYFTDRSAQNSFFASHIVRTVPNCYYQRSDINRTKVKLPYSVLYRCDYLSFINPDYENKRFYGFITGVNYIDDDTTEVLYIIDQVQTWLLDCNTPDCYIERMHSATDDIGDNMLLDSVDCGEYLDRTIQENISTNTMVIFLATFDMQNWIQNGTKTAPSITNRNGIYDCIGIYGCYSELGNTYSGTGNALSKIMADIYNGVGGVTVDDFINIYIYPSIGVSLGTSVDVTGSGELDKLYLIGGAEGGQVYPGQTTDLPDGPSEPQGLSDLDGYVPKNKKMLQFPYCLLHITNNEGAAIDLKFERFRSSSGDIVSPKARVFGTTSSEAKLRLVPIQYLGEGLNDYDHEYGIDSGSYPTVGMTGDAFLIYMAQNKNRIANGYDQMILNAAKPIMQAATNDMKSVAMTYAGGQMGAYASGAAEGAAQSKMFGSMQLGSTFFNTAHQVYQNIQALNAQFNDMAIAPNGAKGLSGTGITFQNKKKNFTCTVKTIDHAHAKTIDDFYTMYGYPYKAISNPMRNIHNRPQFNYIKTVGCIVRGNVPEVAKSTIEQLFDAGIRFWSNQNNIGDYSLNNSPV